MHRTAYQREGYRKLIVGLEAVAAGVHELPPALWALPAPITITLIRRWKGQRRREPEAVERAIAPAGHLHRLHAIYLLEAELQRRRIGHRTASGWRRDTHEEAAAAAGSGAVADIEDLERDRAASIGGGDAAQVQAR